MNSLAPDTEKQLRLFEMFLNASSPEEGYVIATLGTAIRLNKVIQLWKCIEQLSEKLANELNDFPGEFMIRIEVTKEQLQALAEFCKLMKVCEDFLPNDSIIRGAAKALDSARVEQKVYWEAPYDFWRENKNWQEEIW